MNTPLSSLSNSLPGLRRIFLLYGRQQSQLSPKFVNLGQFKRGYPNPLPPLRDPDQGGKDQLQTTLLVKETRNDFGPPLLLLKGSLQKIRRSNTLPMSHRTLQMIQRGLQILREGLHRRWIKLLILLPHLLSSLLPCLMGGGFKDRTKVSLHFRDRLRGKFGHNVTGLMNQTCSMARINPGAPSKVIIRRAFNPRLTMSLNKSLQFS